MVLDNCPYHLASEFAGLYVRATFWTFEDFHSDFVYEIFQCSFLTVIGLTVSDLSFVQSNQNTFPKELFLGKLSVDMVILT